MKLVKIMTEFSYWDEIVLKEHNETIHFFFYKCVIKVRLRRLKGKFRQRIPKMKSLCYL